MGGFYPSCSLNKRNTLQNCTTSKLTYSSTGGLIGRFCGSSLPPVLTSTASRMAVVFESDESIAHEGFSANYVVLDAATGKKRLKSSTSHTG